MDSQDSDSGRTGHGHRDLTSRGGGGQGLNINAAVSGVVPSAQDRSVEVARHRALQAAEYYHKNVVGGASGEGSRDEQGVLQANGSMSNDALRAGVTPQSSDAYYKAKLRAGFIDLRNSYNEKSRPRMNAYAAGGRGPVDRGGLGRVQERVDLGRGDMRGVQDSPGNTGTPRHLNERRGLYRSNSSLELEYIDDHHHHLTGSGLGGSGSGGMGTLRRDYGSASSLDVMSTSGESFFAMLQDYRNDNQDQRAPAPPQLHEVLRGRVDFSSTAAMRNQTLQQQQQRRPLSLQQTHELSKISNGAVPVEDDPPSEGSGSPRLKSKSQKNKERKPRTKSMVGEASSGILKKLRGGNKSGEGAAAEVTNNGGKADNSPGEAEGSSRLDDRQKRKAFVHYDCQSIGISIAELIRRRMVLNKRKNTTTGASAASAMRSAHQGAGSGSDESRSGEDLDPGDGKSNELVLACPFFRNEVGGEEEQTLSLNRATAQKRVQQLLSTAPLPGVESFTRDPACNGVSVLDTTPSPTTGLSVHINSLTPKGLMIEHVDHGAFYYRNFFLGFDHQNFFGMDDQLGPVAISLKREKLDEKDCVGAKPELVTGALYQYRLILRTSDLTTMRGCVLEDVVPSSSRLSSTRGLPVKDVLDFVLPELNLSNLKVATPGTKTQEQLVKLDEQGISKTYKIGIMYCKAGQATEEEMYNNETSGPAFDEFIDCIGQRVRLKGFDKYRGGLDCKTDSSGLHSVYTAFHDYEIMFHVSTLLPFTANNKQQLLRKRHIGNDIVTIVFQEPGALPFTPKTVRSHFQHVFIIVRAHHCGSTGYKYSLAISRSKDVPVFGPPIPEGSMFSRSTEFAEFLLTKAINAENAAHKSDKFIAMATRTRQEYLKDLATNFVSTTSLDSGSKLSKFSLGSGRKKDRPKTRSVPDVYTRGALTWAVTVEDFASSDVIDCFMAIGAESVVVLEDTTREVLFTTSCQSLIGWTSGSNSLRLFYGHGECVAINFGQSEVDEVAEVVARLGIVCKGCETQEMMLRRNGLGQLGFHVHYEGVVSDVEPYSLAWQTGLRQGSRLVEICNVATATLTHDQMVDLLRTSMTVKVVVVAPHEDGLPRGGFEESRSTGVKLSAALTHSSSIDSLGLDEVQHTRVYKTRSEHQSKSNRQRHEPLSAVHSLPAYAADQSGNDVRTDRHHADNPHDLRYEPSSHQKQASQDSAASRSSGHGSLDGPTSESHTSRLDNHSSDGFISSEERHSRHSSRDTTRGAKSDWSGHVTIYPAYTREQDAHGNQRPKTRQYGDHSKSLSHLAAGTPLRSNADHADSYGNSGATYVSRANYLSASAAAAPDKHRSSHHTSPGSQGKAAATSMSNLSDLSSSHSSGGGGSLKRNRDAEQDFDQEWERSHHERSRSHEDRLRPHEDRSRSHDERSRSHDDPDRPPERPPLPQEIQDKLPQSEQNALLPQLTHSPSGRRRQTIVGLTSGRRDYLNVSPHSSANSSPRGSRRNLSEESLATRLRPGVSPAPSKMSTARSLPSSTFQEELMRLIDPDVSLAELENSISKESRSSVRRSSNHRLQRTLSDESMCSTPMGRSQRALDPLSGDVLFSSTHPSHSRHTDQLAREKRYSAPVSRVWFYRLSPRVMQDLPSNLNRLASSNHARSSPMLPLPDTASSLEWASLVDAAKAFEGADAKGAAGGAVAASHPEYSASASGGTDDHMGMKTSKSQDSSHAPPTKHQLTAAKSSPASATSNAMPNSYSARHQNSSASNSTWRGSPEGAAQQIHDLESQVAQLQQQLEKEQKSRVDLEVEVGQLQQENLRLQEESQTAAAQLRKFTEWFFNTIDRQ